MRDGGNEGDAQTLMAITRFGGLAKEHGWDSRPRDTTVMRVGLQVESAASHCTTGAAQLAKSSMPESKSGAEKK